MRSGGSPRSGARQNGWVRVQDRRSLLRGAVYRGDGPAVVGLLRAQPWPVDALQLIGDGLLAALPRQVEHAPELAGDCVRALRDRDWTGDRELADQLDARLGTGPTPVLRPLPVDLDELAGLLEGDQPGGGGRMDLRTGELWHRAAIQYLHETGAEDPDDSDDPDRWLWIHSEGSHAGYRHRDMQEFIDTVTDPDRADRLGIAIQGRGAFRRFKDVIARWPTEQDRWYAFTEERQRGRARAWLTDAGYTPTPPPTADT